MLSKLSTFIGTLSINKILAFLVGALVVALKLEGSALHKAHIQLLETQMDDKDKPLSDKVDAARTAYEAARKGLFSGENK